MTLSPRVLVGVEVTGARSAHAALGSSYVQWQAGGNLALSGQSTLDWGIIRGETASSPRLALQIGYSRTFDP